MLAGTHAGAFANVPGGAVGIANGTNEPDGAVVVTVVTKTVVFTLKGSARPWVGIEVGVVGVNSLSATDGSSGSRGGSGRRGSNGSTTPVKSGTSSGAFSTSTHVLMTARSTAWMARENVQ
jgi:hypothetical protein